MNKEQLFFLQILSDYIQCNKTELVEGIDWNCLFDYAQSHQLTAVVYAQCKDIIPNDVVEKYKGVFLASISANVRRKKITNDILTKLREQAICSYIVKGAVIADYYQNWQYRTMGDTDILVNDIEKAHLILLQNGFINESKDAEQPWHYNKAGMQFELHDRLVYKEHVYRELFDYESAERFLNDYQNYLSDNNLSDSFHFIYVLYHLRHHFSRRGAGFRQFVDVAVLIRNNKCLNWEWIEDQLINTKMISFAKTVFCFIEKWFGVFAPIASSTVPDYVFSLSTEFTFSNGVFGFDNEENKYAYAANTAHKSRFPRISMILLAFKKIFPSYEVLIISEHYSFLKSKPLLLPIAWLYRWGRVIKNRGFNESKKQVSRSFVPKDYYAKREEMFGYWGLQ